MDPAGCGGGRLEAVDGFDDAAGVVAIWSCEKGFLLWRGLEVVQEVHLVLIFRFVVA